jgi:triacylglycerol lipase
MSRPRKTIPDLPRLDLLVPPVKHAVYRFFAPADQRPAFEAQPSTAVSWANAWWLSDFSLLAYGDRDYIVQGLDGSGFTLRAEHCFAHHGTKCFVAASDQAIVVSFCGSEAPQFDLGTLLFPGAAVSAVSQWVSTLVQSSTASASDWMRNAALTLADFSRDHPAQGRVHSGFLEGFAAVEAGLLPALNQLLAQQDRPIWYTGHSLGGALAHLAAVRFNRPAGLYTYGCPRVGDAAFVNACPAAVVAQRFCVLGDPVPLVPTHAPPTVAGLGGAYLHAGNAFWLSAHAPPQALSNTDIPVTLVNPVQHAPVIYSNLLWNLHA